MKKFGRIAIFASVCVLFGCVANAGESWPRRSVEFVVTASAGGDTDFNARTIGKYFRDIAGASLVVTNMPGGGGSIATSNIKNARPDGSKGLFCHTGQLIVNEVSGLIDYSFEDFAISCIAGMNTSYVFVASKESGITSLTDLVEKAKANPNTIIFGTEMGGFTHLQGLRLAKESGIDLKMVDTGSTSEKVTSLLAGRIDFAAVSYGSVQDYQQTGDLIILAQGGAERNHLLGDIPTIMEQGIPFAMEFPYVVSFPKGTSPEIVQRMSAIVKQITELPQYAKDLEDGYKQTVAYHDTEDAIEYLKKVRDDFMQYKELLKN
jgi:Uncharacterized protein conserved in bacteria